MPFVNFYDKIGKGIFLSLNIREVLKLSDTKTEREDRLVAMAGGDKSLAIELALIFLKHYDEMHEQLRAAIAGDDPLEVRRMVHTIEGSLGSMGSSDSVAFLMDLGQAGRDSRVDLFGELFDRYDKSITMSNEVLRDIASQSD